MLIAHQVFQVATVFWHIVWNPENFKKKEPGKNAPDQSDLVTLFQNEWELRAGDG